ncbi:TPA: LamG domain-containing protein [Candidatus Poribacteria bacterium]|nr:LamG domain-containing protein [Candidatus Poribacteria bacterium]
MKVRVSRIALICIGLIFMGLVLPSQSFAFDYEKHLAGLWKFDEGSGKKAKDDSGNKLTGELEGGCKWVDGKFGKAIQFDGKTGFVNIKAHANPTKAITVSAWVKSETPAWNNHGFIMSKRNAYIIHNNQGGVNVSFPICNGGCWNKPGGWQDGEVGPKDITKWHMYTGTFDSKTGDWRILIDGKVESKLQLTKQPIAAEAAMPLWIGRDNCCGARYGDITVDEVMVFDTVLGEDDLKPLYEGGIDLALSVDSIEKLAVTWGDVKTQY